MSAGERAQARLDRIAKPLRSLGRLEELIVQLADIQGTEDVCIAPRCALVFCGDHGVVAEGVSQSGSGVTALVARAIAEGTSNVSLMAAASGTDVLAVDMGMLEDVPGVLDCKVARGTANMARGPAMTRAQAEQALFSGRALVGEMKAKGYRLIATGEMGIGNTTACAAMACALLRLAPQEAAGHGAGLSDAGLARKRDAIARALAVNRPDPDDPVDLSLIHI